MASTPARIEAERLLGAGLTDEAIAAYRRLLTLDPSRADDWFNLAWLQKGARAFEDSLGSYAKALALGIARGEEVHLNRAVIFSEHLGDVAGAKAELLKAVALNPDFTLAWLNLGNLCEDLGAVDEARDAYEKSLGASPGNGRALARLTAIDIFAGKAGSRIEPLRAALRRPGLDLDQTAEILFALGAALDAEARYDEAFDAILQANTAVRRRLGLPGRYDRAAHERLVNALIAAPPLPMATESRGDPVPIFLCGMFRSGSTLAEQLLARHSLVTAGGELDLIPWLVTERLDNDPLRLAQLTPRDVTDMRGAYLEQVRALHPGAGIITDKRSDNFLYIGLIKAMFPSARIIHNVRAPVDNILSVFFLYFADSVRYGWAVDDIAHWFTQYRRIMAHWQTRFGADIQAFSYDALVAAPETELARALVFCGLSHEPLLQAAPDNSAVRTASAWQVRKPLHARSSGRWRHYPAAAAQVRALIGEDKEQTSDIARLINDREEIGE